LGAAAYLLEAEAQINAQNDVRIIPYHSNSTIALQSDHQQEQSGAGSTEREQSREQELR